MIKLLYYVAGASLLFYVILCPQLSPATDNLFLTGIVKSINGNNINIDVRSESCKGLRTFRVPDSAAGELNASFISKKIHFNIDSAKCEKGKIYTILTEVKP